MEKIRKAFSYENKILQSEPADKIAGRQTRIINIYFFKSFTVFWNPPSASIFKTKHGILQLLCKIKI
jgi:hypothetical protein